MEKRKKELIIRIILIIIIILLLINNYKLIRTFKNKTSKIPTGNVDIFEIYCDEETCGKEEKQESTVSQKNEEKITTKTDKPVNVNSKKETNTNNTGAITNNNETTNNNNNTNNNTSNDNTTTGNDTTNNDTNNSTPGNDGNTGNDSSISNNEGFFVSNKSIRWDSTNELRIFNNPVYNMDPKIAPGDSNIYQFVVRNNTTYNVIYSIKFNEENDSNLNIKYRLRKGNTYIAGNNSYVDYNQLDQNGIILNSGEKDTYYLEWKWIGTDNDNDVAGIQAAYSINIEIEAESINE